MVKLITQIENRDLPTISNNFFPNPVWSSSNSFDYKQYYDKKRGLRTFQQARNKASCKPDQNFKVDNGSKHFYNITDYSTLMNVSKYYRNVHPYCELTNEGGNVIATGEEIFLATTTIDGIAGRETTQPYVLNENNKLTPTTINKIKGAIPYNNCTPFKNGFSRRINYTFRF